jgi:hypothetical protein
MIIIYSVYYKTLPGRISRDEDKIPHYDCNKSRYGCCNDRITTRLDQNGTNCIYGGKRGSPVR